MQVPFVDLKAQAQSIKASVMPEIESVVDNCNFILGGPVAEFEQEFAGFVHARHCVGVASGTEALHLAAKAVGIQPGDKVLLPANTFIATALGAHYAGAKIELVDPDEDTHLVSAERYIDKATADTRAFMPVHLYGRAIDLTKLVEHAGKNGRFVIEDAAQAHGANCNGKYAGAQGDVAGFSFYPGKNLGAYGDGGAVTTNSDSLTDRLQSLRNYGSPKKYHHPEIGFNSRLDTMQAVVLREKLKKLAEWNKSRNQAARKYDECLQGIGDLVLPEVPADAGEHIFHLYVVRTQRRDELLKFLNDNGVQSGIHYPTPIHLHGAFEHLGYRQGAFPVAEKLCSEILSLPMFPEISDQQIMYVRDTIKKFFG